MTLFADRRTLGAAREHDEWLLDEAIRETFPASDPVAVYLPQALPAMSHAVRRRIRVGAPPTTGTAWWIAGAVAIFCAGYLVGRGRR